MPMTMIVNRQSIYILFISSRAIGQELIKHKGYPTLWFQTFSPFRANDAAQTKECDAPKWYSPVFKTGIDLPFFSFCPSRFIGVQIG